MCRANPKLCLNIIEILHQHLSVYLDLRPDALNPVVMKRLVVTQGDITKLQEPLGELLSCLASCKIYYETKRRQAEDLSTLEEDEEDEESSVTALNDVCCAFDVLSQKLSSCDIEDLEFDSRSDFSSSSDGQKNYCLVQVIVSVYDAVIQHSFYTDTANPSNNMQLCVDLFKKRCKLVELVKVMSEFIFQSCLLAALYFIKVVYKIWSKLLTDIILCQHIFLQIYPFFKYNNGILFHRLAPRLLDLRKLKDVRTLSTQQISSARSTCV